MLGVKSYAVQFRGKNSKKNGRKMAHLAMISCLHQPPCLAGDVGQRFNFHQQGEQISCWRMF